MDQAQVARVLIDYGRELDASGAAQVGGTFSGFEPADQLIEQDPNAFVLGVLFTQGIPAERAWKAPWLLRERLGTIEPEALAAMPQRVREAVQTPPMLHRFKETMPRWIVAAASHLVAEYEGDASEIWRAGSSVVGVTERLSAFDGIGRKKAVMATEILMRHFGVELQGREAGQVAYDIQVRRVFLRSGLVEEDTRAAVEAVACLFSPDAPGLLDLPAWLIGRQTCRPKVPRCAECVLGEVCARRVWLTPVGVGARRGAEGEARGASGYSAERNTRPESSLG